MSDHHSMERHDDAPSSQCCTSGESYRLASTDIARIALAGLLVLAEYLNWLPIVGGWKLVGLLATATLAWPIFKEGAKAALRARMTMSLAMSIALVAALSLSEVFTALVITLSVLVAEEIEKFTIFRGKSSIARLLDLLPKTAYVRQGEAVVEVGVEQVHKGDILVVKPGSRIVVDGVVVSGRAFVDESTITGESLPQEKLPGQRVYAGSISQSGALEVSAESVGQETTFGKIIAAVSDAESNRGQMQKLSDRLAAYLVYFSLAMAAVTWFMTGDLRQTISVIIVSGACGIAAGTPLAIFAALGRTARGGTIVKGGIHVEQLATVDTVVFDKTGTLTQAAPRLLKLVPMPGTSESELLQLAVTAETLSEHPVARAIREAGEARSLTAGKSSNFLYLPGRGVLCTVESQQVLAGNRKLLLANGVSIPESYQAPTGLTEVLVASGGVFKGGLYIGDRLRSDAAEAIRQLKQLGLKVMILSGDAESAVARVAEQLGVSDFSGALVPEEKLARIKQLVAEGRRVAMVGDGVNDAPALAEATVGVAMGSGTDVAQESADVVLIGSGLLRLVDAIKVARQCKRVIMFNFAGTILIDAIGMGLAFAGLLSPILAALVHVGSEVAFLVNSARLLPWFRKE